MAVASHPRLIVLDEPTTGLDVATQNEVLAMMSRVCSSHDIAAIYISHDLAVVGHVADTIVVLYAGRIVENGLKEQILSCPSHPYTRALLAAMPSVSEARLPMPIHGKTPPLADRDEAVFFEAAADLQKKCVRCHLPSSRSQSFTTCAVTLPARCVRNHWIGHRSSCPGHHTPRL